MTPSLRMMRVADVAGALKFLATQPDVRADRIGVPVG